MIRSTGALGLGVVSEELPVDADVARGAAGGFRQIVERDATGWPGPGDRFAFAAQRPGEGAAHIVAVVVPTPGFGLIAVRSLVDADVLVRACRRLGEVVEFNAGGGPLGLGDRDANGDEGHRGQ